MGLRRTTNKIDYSGPHDCIGDLCKCKQLGGKRKVKNDPKSIRDRSKSQENRIAESYQKVGFPDAKRVFGSGAHKGLPGDVDPGALLLVEAKETRASKSNPGGRLTIDPEWILKVRNFSQEKGYRGWYALHAWAAPDGGNYYKAVVIPEELWWEIIRVFKAMQEDSQMEMFGDG